MALVLTRLSHLRRPCSQAIPVAAVVLSRDLEQQVRAQDMHIKRITLVKASPENFGRADMAVLLVNSTNLC